MATLSYEELEYRYNPYTKQIEQIDVSPDEIIATINLSTEWVYIDWDNIILDWNVTVDWTFTISKITDSLYNTDFQAVANPTDWVVFDGGWIRWYSSWVQTFWIDNWGTALFSWDVIWSTIAWSILQTGNPWDERVVIDTDWVIAWDWNSKWVELTADWTNRLIYYWNLHWYNLAMDTFWTIYEAWRWWWIHWSIIPGLASTHADWDWSLVILNWQEIHFLDEPFDSASNSQAKSKLFVSSSSWDLVFTDRNGVQTTVVAST